MAIVIQPYRPEHEAKVREFNQRLEASGAETDLVFYETARPRWLPHDENDELYNEFFLALDNGNVRGGYALKHQKFSFPDGSTRTVSYYHHPLSEGIVNKAYAIVGGLLLRDAMQRSPLLYCLGMGGYERPLPQMLVRMGWNHCLVPFYFRVVRPARFLREMQALRTSPLRRALMDLAAFSGVAWAAGKTFHAFKQLSSSRVPCQSQVFGEFSAWADDLWRSCRMDYGFTAVRDLDVLRRLYPASEAHLTKIQVMQNGAPIGWAVVGEKRRDPKYGSLRVGSIVDCWGSPEHALPIIRAAVQELERAGMDLIVSNQSNRTWCAAMEAAGFLNAESNFIFAASKPLGEFLKPFDESRLRMHLTRADGDGLPRNY